MTEAWDALLRLWLWFIGDDITNLLPAVAMLISAWLFGFIVRRLSHEKA